MSDRQPRNLGAYLCGTIAAVSPFDVAIPRAGWTNLFLRPLWALTALATASALFHLGHKLDRRLVLAVTGMIAALVSAALLSDDPTAAYAVAVRLGVVFGLFLAATASVSSSADLRLVLPLVALGALASSIVGLAVYRNGGDLWITKDLLGSISYTNGVQRLTRPFSQANVAAMYLAPVAAILLASSIPDRSGWSRWSRLVWLGSGLVAALALSLTLSRGGSIALGLAMVALLWLTARKSVQSKAVPLLVIGSLILLRLVGPGWSQRSAPFPDWIGRRTLSRTAIWDQAFEAFRDEPVIGVGPGQFGEFSLSRVADGFAAVPHAHSVPLEFLATGGLLLGVPLVLLFGVVVFVCKDGFRQIPVALAAGSVAVLFHMLVDYPLVFSSSGNLVAIVLGATVGQALPVPTRAVVQP